MFLIRVRFHQQFYLEKNDAMSIFMIDSNLKTWSSSQQEDKRCQNKNIRTNFSIIFAAIFCFELFFEGGVTGSVQVFGRDGFESQRLVPIVRHWAFVNFRLFGLLSSTFLRPFSIIVGRQQRRQCRQRRRRIFSRRND